MNFITDDLCSHLLMLRNKQISTQLEYITLRSVLDYVPLFSLRYIEWVFFIYLFLAWTAQKWKLAHF